MRHPSYTAEDFHGQRLFRCCQCKYDGFLEENVQDHVKNRHLPIELPDPAGPITPNPTFAGVKVAISLLTWNDGEVAAASFTAVNRELLVLGLQGIETLGIWVDNGSESIPEDACRASQGNNWRFLHNLKNEGQSKARNQILAEARRFDADFLIMVDGDIIMIPNSGIGLMGAIDRQPLDVACVGFSSSICTADPADPYLAQDAREILYFQDKPEIAWTQYGIFDRDAIKLDFDCTGPFSGPGYGLEDDDFYLQMLDSGYRALSTNLFTYLHMRRGSSISKLGASLAAKLWKERHDYLMAKWKDHSNPSVQRRLSILANQRLNPLALG